MIKNDFETCVLSNHNIVLSQEMQKANEKFICEVSDICYYLEEEENLEKSKMTVKKLYYKINEYINNNYRKIDSKLLQTLIHLKFLCERANKYVKKIESKLIVDEIQVVILNYYFNDDYVVKDVIAKGGMGKVFRAKTKNLKTTWAIKQIYQNNIFNKLPNEGEILRDIDHSMVPKVVEVKKYGKFTYIIEEYVDGVNLKEYIIQKGKIDKCVILKWSVDLAKLLRYLHVNNIIYRDLKPENIMVKKNQKLMLIDFGLARTKGQIIDEVDVIGMGSKAYAAPEQFKKMRCNESTDIYALGLVIYFMCYNEVCRKDNSHVVLDEMLLKKKCLGRQGAINNVIVKCTQHANIKRYHRMDDIIGDLQIIQSYHRFALCDRIHNSKIFNKIKLVFPLALMVFIIGLHMSHFESSSYLLDNGAIGKVFGPKSYIVRAEIAYNQGDYERAIELYKLQIEVEEDNQTKSNIYLIVANIYKKELNNLEAYVKTLKEGIVQLDKTACIPLIRELANGYFEIGFFEYNYEKRAYYLNQSKILYERIKALGYSDDIVHNNLLKINSLLVE